MNGTIAIFMDHPRCSVDGVNAIMNSLNPHYKFKILTKHKVQDPDFWNDVDIVCIPGGIGDADTFKKIMKHQITPIKDFLARGGRYLGICMGAYWAGPNYLDILKGRDCVQYLARPKTDTRRPHAKDLEVTWLGNKENIFWYDGCAITGKGQFDVVATYANGDVMAGYQGRIGLIGSHPEAEKFWYDEYTWMKPKYIGKERNHELLHDFVDELMKR
ncbi:MAG: hypothetical protein EBY16_06920 [Gammaproteobacteria bacterium]|nr:hypothetical protein [Gammaproteobacteria bacterium]